MGAVNTLAILIALSSSPSQVRVLEGDTETVSPIDGGWGLRFDDGDNDLAAVIGRYVAEVTDVEATLVLFTTFDDLGRGGRAYSVPIFNDTSGTGLEPIDRRAEFRTERFVQLVNMKSIAGHRDRAALLELLAHELAHRHLAYLSTTSTVPIVGRQDAHWHAALATEGSIMGGYGWAEVGPEVFEVIAKNERFSSLDLYALGLFDPAEVEPFFFIDELRTEEGFSLPESAELFLGDRALGRRRDLSIDEVIEAAGPRARERAPMRAVFAVLTEPGLSATSTTAQTTVAAVEEIRAELEDSWRDLTRARGALCTTIKGCEAPPPPPVEESGCGCATIERRPSDEEGRRTMPASAPREPVGSGALTLLLGLFLLRRRSAATPRRG